MADEWYKELLGLDLQDFGVAGIWTKRSGYQAQM